jgi:hypothetical protein
LCAAARPSGADISSNLKSVNGENHGRGSAFRESLALVYVTFNNTSYRILEQRTKALKGFSAEDDRYVAMDLDKPRRRLAAGSAAAGRT